MTSSTTTTRTPLPSQPQSSILRRKTMSITQTYYLAHTARGKLSHEAARHDHNLRLLVGHANLLDSLMLELADAEQEQESWFNQSVKTASSPAPAQNKHIQWADSIIEEPEEDWQAEDADSSDSDDSDFEDDDDVEMAGTLSLKKLPVQVVLAAAKVAAPADIEEEEFEEDDEEDYAALALIRTTSHAASPSSPPELSHHYDSEDSSDDEAMPPSPPSTSLPTFSEKQRQQIATTSFYEQSSTSISLSEKLSPSEQQSFFNDGYYLPARDTVPGLAAALVY